MGNAPESPRFAALLDYLSKITALAVQRLPHKGQTLDHNNLLIKAHSFAISAQLAKHRTTTKLNRMIFTSSSRSSSEARHRLARSRRSQPTPNPKHTAERTKK
eukprot:5445250-Amphidinium_carterae.1